VQPIKDNKMKQYQFECVIDLPWVNPVRNASSKEEFIENILAEYNEALCGIVEILPSDIRKNSIKMEVITNA
tara:strand:+ start:140 stop:355 length:216 start_codon:yes stop_codon:yes gene_type:complete